MKKFLILLLFVLCFNIISVQAVDEVNTNVLYPVDSSFSAVTDTFNYDSIIYNSMLDGSGKATITIGNVYNSTKKKVPVSISLGLFDSEKKNIGVVNYCSTEDLESDYAFKTLTTGQSTYFAIKVSQDKHVAEGKQLANAAYVAVLSDNKYCKIGGKDKYIGLTIDEIVDGQISTKVEKVFSLDFLKNLKLKNISKETINKIIFFAIILLVYILIGKIINALNNRMFNKKTILAYIPVANVYLAVKLAFGPTIGKIYLVVYLLSIIVGVVLPILPLLLSSVGGIAFLIVIVKLISKKYDMLYFENFNLKRNKQQEEKKKEGFNSNNNDIYDINKGINNDLLDDKESKNFLNDSFLDENTDDKNTNDNFDNSNNDLLKTLGVNLDDNNSDRSEENEGFFNVSSGGLEKEDSEGKNNESNKSGSDLTDLFK